MNLNPLAVLEEINANYKTRYESRFCNKCGGFRAHLLAVAPVPGTNDLVVRHECCECHSGETRLI